MGTKNRTTFFRKVKKCSWNPTCYGCGHHCHLGRTPWQADALLVKNSVHYVLRRCKKSLIFFYHSILSHQETQKKLQNELVLSSGCHGRRCSGPTTGCGSYMLMETPVIGFCAVEDIRSAVCVKTWRIWWVRSVWPCVSPLYQQRTGWTVCLNNWRTNL
jgi:hypothetical protein